LITGCVKKYGFNILTLDLPNFGSLDLGHFGMSEVSQHFGTGAEVSF